MYELELGVLNIVKAPVGSGKTTWATQYLTELVDFQDEILYLIDTINGREQLISSGHAKQCDHYWREKFARGIVSFSNDGVPIMTYAKFGALTEYEPDFANHFSIIVCDEIHNLIRFDSFVNIKSKEEKRYCKMAKEKLEQIVLGEQTLVVALSATPKTAQENMHCPLRMIKVDEDIREYETKTTEGYTNIEYLVEQQCKSGTGLIYTGHIRTMKKLHNMLTEKGIPSIAIWSITNANNPMNEEQLAARQHILDKEELPPQYKAVIINASCETSINIKSKVDYMVIHTVEEEVQIQVRGRCRNDLDRLYVLSHDALIVPPEYLDRKLFAADKSKLCDILHLTNERGNVVRWPTVRKRLLEAGFNVDEGREGYERYHVISL